ncbi:MAG: GTP 3',8-cyclase MoaA [Planctomycetota bacterium]
MDAFGRAIRMLRISVTDRCNLRCDYCRGLRPFRSFHHDDILRYEEIVAVVAVAAGLGVRRYRLTGGEPLVRRGIERLVEMLRAVEGVEELALTTNGTLLAAKAAGLASAGLDRVTLSIDSLKPARYRRITGGGDLDEALRGLEAARRAGLVPVKVNVVVMNAVNDDEIEAFVRFGMDRDVEVRFIEHMPTLQADEEHLRLFVPGAVIREKLRALGEWTPVDGPAGAPARRWRCESLAVTVGLITPISEPFCAHCRRFRMTADGKLKHCLWSEDDLDLRSHLRPEVRRERIVETFLLAARRKPWKCNEFRRMAMHQVGG